MKRYYTTRWNTEIEEKDVVRETDAFVILPDEKRRKERREAKKSEYHLYHETWDFAHAYLLQRAKDRVAWSQSELEGRKNDLKVIENMQPPLNAVEC